MTFLKSPLITRLCLPLLLFISPSAFAQLPGIISQQMANGAQNWSLPIHTLVFITTLTLLPAMLLMCTSFTRIIIVLVCCEMRWLRRPHRQIRCCSAWDCF